MSLDEIYITRWGSGPPVVMVHGSAQGGPAGGAEQFGAQRPLVDHGWELVLPDRPGHGRSPSRGPEDLELDAVWVAWASRSFGTTEKIGASISVSERTDAGRRPAAHSEIAAP
jgi:pimeloyl-ACP methyl ester carboxylesterase